MSALSNVAKTGFSGRLEEAPRPVQKEASQYSCTCNEELGMAGSSKTMCKLREEILAMAPLGAPVVVSGETGTGKELTARALHLHGKSGNGPFVAVNCGALPETLAEDIFFGHEKGSYTGAESSKKGVFELAEGGTLFLDEIGELPLSQQAALLRVLENRVITRLEGIRKDKFFRSSGSSQQPIKSFYRW